MNGVISKEIDMDFASKLSFHGKTKEMCDWVILTYANNEYYKDNTSVQDWLRDSYLFLVALEEDRKWDQALEVKFGKN